MMPEGIGALMNGQQGFWTLLQSYFINSLMNDSVDTSFFSDIWSYLRIHPFSLLMVVLFLLLLCVSLFASGFALTQNSCTGKEEQLKRQLEQDKKRCKKTADYTADELMERELS